MEKKEINDFRDLNVWKACKELRNRSWKIVQSFPGEEKYRLSDQIIRASRSVTACIAEGYGRFHFQENIQFCRQARGSLYELMDHFDVAHDCGYISSKQSEDLIVNIKDCILILNKFIKYLENQKNTTNNQ
jgi:four helix bundle protein